MTDVKKMDESVQELIKVKNELSGLDYNDERYDEVEEKLHDLEDNFVEKFGDFLEEVLHNVHDEYCPDNDVLLPIAYLAKEYSISSDNQYDVAPNSGVFVDADDYPGKNTRLVLIPNPLRIVMNIDKENRETLWTAG